MTKLYRKAADVSAATVEPQGARASIYDEVTASIIEQLEAGIAPWAKPWTNKATGAVMPINKDGRRYSGVNVLLLWGAMISRGYSSATFMTFKQAKDLGGCVRKGEKATSIVYADRFVPKGEAEKAAQEGRDAAAIPFLKRYSVFNVEQIDGLPARFYETAEPISLVEQNEAGERLIRASGADFRIGGDKAFYSIDGDYVQVPPQPAFHHAIEYYRTAAHELCHWTGSAKRLARKFGLTFGNADYAKEELVAELGAAFLCASLGINPTVRHADYLGSWLRVLKADNKAIFKAASQASKAADFLLALYDASPDGDDPKGTKGDDVEPVAVEPVAVDPVGQLADNSRLRAHLVERDGKRFVTASFTPDGIYKSLENRLAEANGCRYASHRAGYRFSVRAWNRFVEALRDKAVQHPSYQAALEGLKPVPAAKAAKPAPAPVAPSPQPVEGEREAEPVLFRLMPEEVPAAERSDAWEPVEPVSAPQTVEQPIASPCVPADVSAYYAGGRRVMRDGVPCKVFSRPRSAETTALIDRLAMVCAGKVEWEGDPNFPGFSFKPAVDRKGAGKRSAASAVKVSPAVKSYYEGGHRFIIDGVPVRLASKPTRNSATLLRQNKAFAPMSQDFGPLYLCQSAEERQAEAAWLERMGFQSDRVTPLPKRRAACSSAQS